MEIGPVSNNHQVPHQGPKPDAHRPEEVVSEGIVDKIEISEDARARLSELADQALKAEKTSPEVAQASREDRLTLIRERIESGYYNRPEVDEAVADRLIDDLEG